MSPSLEITESQPAGDVINVGKEIIYRDVHLFIDQATRVAKTNPNVADHLHTCLRGSAMQWFSSLPSNEVDSLIGNLPLFAYRLKEKYTISSSMAIDKLHTERFTMKDAQELRSVDEYVQAILRYGRSARMEHPSALMQAWKNLDWDSQYSVRMPALNTTTDGFIKELEGAVELWASRARQMVSSHNPVNSDAIEAAYQRGLKPGQRQNNRPQYSNNTSQNRAPWVAPQ